MQQATFGLDARAQARYKTGRKQGTNMHSKDTDNKSTLEKYKSKKCNNNSRSLWLPECM